jgi:hypothetical protein
LLREQEKMDELLLKFNEDMKNWNLEKTSCNSGSCCATLLKN